MKVIIAFLLFTACLAQAADPDSLLEAEKINSQLKLLIKKRQDAKQLVHLQFQKYYAIKDALPDTSSVDRNTLERQKQEQQRRLSSMMRSNLITKVEMERRQKLLDAQFDALEKRRIDAASEKSLALLNSTIKSNDVEEIKRLEKNLDSLTISNHTFYLRLVSSGRTNDANKVLACSSSTDYELVTQQEFKKRLFKP